jgi:hypothetical protein
MISLRYLKSRGCSPDWSWHLQEIRGLIRGLNGVMVRKTPVELLLGVFRKWRPIQITIAEAPLNSAQSRYEP